MIEAGSALLPGLFAGVVAVGVTLAIERFGGKIGGVLGTLPTTIVPAGLGIYAASATTADFQDALAFTPVGMLLNVGFLWLWRAIPPLLPKGWSLGAQLAAMVTLGLSVWAVLAAGGVLLADALRSQGVPTFVLGVSTLVITVVVGALACLQHVPAPRGKNRVGLVPLLARGVLAAAAIFVSVWIAQVGGSLLAGVAAVFPAIFMTTMVSLWLSQGAAVPSGAVGPMMLGSSSVSAFSLLAVKAMPTLGPGWGALAAWLGAVVLVTLPASLWLRRR